MLFEKRGGAHVGQIGSGTVAALAHLYDLQCDKPEILVTRDLRLEVPERMRHDGRVETPLVRDTAVLDPLLADLSPLW